MDLGSTKYGYSKFIEWKGLKKLKYRIFYGSWGTLAYGSQKGKIIYS